MGKDISISSYHNNTWSQYDSAEIKIQNLVPVENIFTKPLHQSIDTITNANEVISRNLSILDKDYASSKMILMKLHNDSKPILSHPMLGYGLMLALYIIVAFLITALCIALLKKCWPSLTGCCSYVYNFLCYKKKVKNDLVQSISSNSPDLELGE